MNNRRRMMKRAYRFATFRPWFRPLCFVSVYRSIYEKWC